MSASFTTLAGQPYEESGSALGKGYGLINLNTRFHGTDTYPTAMKVSSATWITPWQTRVSRPR